MRLRLVSQAHPRSRIFFTVASGFQVNSIQLNGDSGFFCDEGTMKVWIRDAQDGWSGGAGWTTIGLDEEKTMNCNSGWGGNICARFRFCSSETSCGLSTLDCDPDACNKRRNLHIAGDKLESDGGVVSSEPEEEENDGEINIIHIEASSKLVPKDP